MINLLLGKQTYDDCPEGVAMIGVRGIYYEISDVAKNLKIFVIQEKRSDIFKELTYSRKKVDQCSTIQTAYGAESKMLSCERAEDEIISPIKDGKTMLETRAIKSHCYGKTLGEILKTPDPVANNWFCCEVWEKNKEQ